MWRDFRGRGGARQAMAKGRVMRMRMRMRAGRRACAVAGVVLAAALGGCTAIGSETPLFEAGSAVAPELRQPRGYKGLDGEARLVVVPRPGNAVGAVFLNDAAGEAGQRYRQEIYVEGAAIALPSGAFVLQSACVIMVNDGKPVRLFSDRTGAPYQDWTFYALLQPAGLADTYWLMLFSGEAGRVRVIAGLAAETGMRIERITLGEYETIIALAAAPGADPRAFFDAVAVHAARQGRTAPDNPVEILLFEPADDIEVTEALAGATVTSCR